ncbi:feline leukemia virus subgroup C receptor-related protein 2-like [Anneissia japonica]|uniref:feline leukemia virus subgroup C receptor-related protein 2-like n=1 Tax=Anneissia japonica TaxID=1529436 RepID=UPI001425B7AC|nr:feline leukemia virus subgroup C receptor-related protein 2-like [Anneissia japonica]
MVAGTISPLIAGMWLDRSKAFRKSTLIFFVSVAVAIFSFAISLNYANMFFTTLSASTYWFCVASVFIVCYEHAVELTYPESEVMSSGLMTGFSSCLLKLIIGDRVLIVRII